MKKKIIVAGFAMAIAAVGVLNINKVSNVNSEMDLANLIAVSTAEAEWVDSSWLCLGTGTACRALLRPGQKEYDPYYLY